MHRASTEAAGTEQSPLRLKTTLFVLLRGLPAALIRLCYDTERLARRDEHAEAGGDAPAPAQTPALVWLHLSWIERQHQQEMLRSGGEKSDLSVELTEGLAKHDHCHKRGDRAALCGSSQPL